MDASDEQTIDTSEQEALGNSGMDGDEIYTRNANFEHIVAETSRPQSFQDQATRIDVEDRYQAFASDENNIGVLCNFLRSPVRDLSFHAARMIRDQLSHGQYGTCLNYLVDMLTLPFSFKDAKYTVNEKHVILDALLNAFAFHSARLSDAVILKTICTALVQFYLQRHFSWEAPTRCLLSTLRSPDGVLPSLEELEASSWGPGISYEPLQALPTLYFVQQLAEEVLETQHLESLYLPPEDEIRDVLRQSLILVFACFAVLPAAAIEIVTALVEISPRLLNLLPQTELHSLLVSQTASTIRTQLKQGDFSSEYISFADLTVAYARSLSFEDANYVFSQTWQTTRPILLDLVSCSGVANIEDTVCSIALCIWIDVADGLEQWTDTEQYLKPTILQDLNDVVRILKTKAQFPADELQKRTSEWDESDRVNFEAFRRDVEELLFSTYSSLGSELLQELTGALLLALESREWQNAEVDIFYLTSFVSVRKDKEDITQCVDQILTAPAWSAMCTSGTLILPDKVTRAAVEFVAELGPYFKANTAHLGQNIGLVIRSLSSSECSGQAARALQSLCLSLHEILVTRFDELFQTLWQYLLPGSSVDAEPKQKILGAMAIVIRALPDEEMKHQAIVHLVNSVEADSVEASNLRPVDEEAASTMAVQVMSTFAEIAKGLKPPQQIDLRPGEYDDTNAFWSQEAPGELRRNLFTHIFNTSKAFSTNADVIEACCATIQAGHSDSPRTAFTASAAENTEFLCALITPESPSISAVLKTAESFLKLNAQSPFTIQHSYATLIHQISSQQQHLLTLYHQSQPQPHSASSSASDIDIHSFTISTLQFHTSTLPLYAPLLFSLPDPPLHSLLSFAFLHLSLPDTLPRRSSATYFATFFSVTSPSLPLPMRLPPEIPPQRLQGILGFVGQKFAREMMGLLAGGCARSDLQVLAGAVKAFIAGHGVLAGRTLREAAKEDISADYNNVKNNVDDDDGGMIMTEDDGTDIDADSGRDNGGTQDTQVSVAAREKFVESMIRLRGGAKTGDVIKAFWQESRRARFGYAA
ncbi:MAG: hypothetical protein Q9160_008477 [Pyrenula sp. 1 TL-2023]